MNEPVVFKVGVGKENITPPIGTALAGYFHVRTSESIRDDLFARAMVVQEGGEQLVIVSCDLIWLSAGIVDEARRLIQQHIGAPSERIMISATHTHTGPVTAADGMGPRDRDYLAALPGRIAKAVVAASKSARDVTLRVGSIDVPGFSSNRLFRLNDGTEVFGKRHRAADVIERCGPCDTQMVVLAAYDLDHRLAGMLVNLPLHVDVIGGGNATAISADWPGEMATAVSAIYGDEVETLFLQGCSGDINHALPEPVRLPNSREDGARRIGRGLAGAAIVCAERSAPMTRGGLKGVLEIERIPYYTRDAAFFGEIARLKAQPERTEMEEPLAKPLAVVA